MQTLTKPVTLNKDGTPRKPHVRPLPEHGKMERYRLRCRCDKCVRANNLYRRLTRKYPSVREPVKFLSDPTGPGFVRLMHDILKPDDEITAAILAKIKARVQDRIASEYRDTIVGPRSNAAAEIDTMTFEQIRSLMHSEIPSLAQTQRHHQHSPRAFL